MISPMCAFLRRYPARRYGEDFARAEEIPGRTVEVVESIDTRFNLEDMFSKLAAAGRGTGNTVSRRGGAVYDDSRGRAAY